MIRLKTEKEIAGIRASGRILAHTLEAIKAASVPGVTTKELDNLAARMIKKAGAKAAFLNYQGFPASLCVSINQQVIHGIPGKYKLKKGDLVSLDLGVILNGYISDRAVSYAVKEADPETAKLIDVTEKSLYQGIEQARVGNRIKDISRAVFKFARKHGFGVVREYCGHGVGLDLHEEPSIPNYVAAGPSPRLTPGMVLAIEPMITQGSGKIRQEKDGWTVVTADQGLSAHFEHTIVVTDKGPKILTGLANSSDQDQS